MNDAPFQFTVADMDVGRRLDQVLAIRLAVSRAEVQRRTAAGLVTVDGRPAANDLKLTAGQIVLVRVANAVATPTTTLVPAIIDEDDAWLVLDKPAGLIMHGGEGIHESTLADWLVHARPDLRSVGEDTTRPGIVHRLDREASGLVVVAKTQTAFEWLKAAFQEHRVEKHYLALVHGQPPEEGGVIDFPIERSIRDGRMAAKPHGAPGRDATSHYTVLEHRPPFTLLDVTTATGRTHQVRVHLHAIGCPIAGDPLYHPKKRDTKLEPPRLFLHATKLTIPHPDGGTRTFTAALSPDLQTFLDHLASARA